ncbi:hypothetical protein SAMN05421678_12438 [Actinopolymorpha cephalotaxi]|uniref:Uncharacterized protein n=1 Tax=Actinopolymorpha cephalotaxi TaxID=504797 RepID=A0A1I3BIB8_9ACTN|nr:hypothetical protein [Actinopolymorpha cephalotaxi]NYH86388.1 hypothetical protein [Actinopolymorpha cephalotaxi]SFH61689.1 hypothetical protein SAMN05421678_12438 [Actinopolymorpha cephalotaxi]
MSRAGRAGWFVLVAAGALVAGCGAPGVQPASLAERPPKAPPSRTPQPGESPISTSDPTADPTATRKQESPSSGTVRVTCATLAFSTPTSWTEKNATNGATYTVPVDEGGGQVSVSGTYFTGVRAQRSQEDLRAVVRGTDGVTLQRDTDNQVVGKLSVQGGTEWRFAQAFDDDRSELVKVTYAPADGSSDDAVTKTTDLLQDAVSKLEISDPGTCDQAPS